jgi:hypothetical protein
VTFGLIEPLSDLLSVDVEVDQYEFVLVPYMSLRHLR